MSILSEEELEKYVCMIDDPDMPLEQKEEWVRDLHKITVAFVDLAWEQPSDNNEYREMVKELVKEQQEP